MKRVVILLLAVTAVAVLLLPAIYDSLFHEVVGDSRALAGRSGFGGAESEPALQFWEESWPAAIYEGRCADYEEEPVFELDDVESRDDAPGEPATAILTSYNAAVDIELGELIDDSYAIGVGDGNLDGPGFVACGEIGQEGDDDERFVGLRSQHGSGVAGIARLRPNDDSTQVTLYVAADLVPASAGERDVETTATPDAGGPFDKATPAPIDATPVAAGTPVLFPTPKIGDQAALDAPESYESPNYGYTVTYDAAVWSVEEAQIDEDDDGHPVDVLVLSNGLTTAELLARFGTLDALRCVEGLGEEMESTEGVTGFAPHRAPSGTPVAGGDEADAFAAFDYAAENTETGSQVTAYVNCRVMPDGEGLLLVFLTALSQNYDAEEPSRAALLAGIELPGAGGTKANGAESGGAGGGEVPLPNSP